MDHGTQALGSRRVNGTLVLVLLTATFSITVTNALMLGPMLVNLSKDFHTTVSVVGQLVAANAFIWAILAPLAGALSDRCGRKPLLVASLAATGLLTALSSVPDNLPALFAVRVLAGIACAAVPAATAASIADYFPPERRGGAYGWLNTAFSVGPLLGVPMVASLTEAGGWRPAFVVVGAIMVLIAAALHKSLPRLRPQGSGSHAANFGALLRSRSVLGLMATDCFERAAYGAIATYTAAYLMQSHGMGVGEAGRLIALLGVGALIGTLAGGRAIGRLEPLVMYPAAQCIAGVVALVIWLPGAIWLVGLGIAAFGIFSMLSRPAYLVMVTQVPARIRGTMMGLSGFSSQLGFTAGAALGGLAIEVSGLGAVGPLVCAASLVAAIACRSLVRPSKLAAVGIEPARGLNAASDLL